MVVRSICIVLSAVVVALLASPAAAGGCLGPFCFGIDCEPYKPACYDCYNQLICTPLGSLRMPCLLPDSRFCSEGNCVSEPSLQCRATEKPSVSPLHIEASVSPDAPVSPGVTPNALVFGVVSTNSPVSPEVSPNAPISPEVTPNALVFGVVSTNSPVSPEVSPNASVSPVVPTNTPVSPEVSPNAPVSPVAVNVFVSTVAPRGEHQDFSNSS